MTNSKNTKRSLIASGIVMLLCIAMLVGATFAWFTDSVTNSGNIIKAGNLKVGFLWAEGTENPTSTQNWNDASTETMFDEDDISALLEPERSIGRHIRISNNGTLALKYQLQIVASNTDVQDGDLANVIDVYYLDEAVQLTKDNKAEILADSNKVGTLAEIMNGTKTIIAEDENVLLPADNKENKPSSVTGTLILKMQNVGNDYQGHTVYGGFEVQLLATQATYETDGFGNSDYDASAEYLVPEDISDLWDGSLDTEGLQANTDDEAKTVMIETAEQLAAFAAAVNSSSVDGQLTTFAADDNSGNPYDGYTVKLLSSIDLAGKEWTPINEFYGIFDGNGKTIYNLTVHAETYNESRGVGFFGKNTKDAKSTTGTTVKNLTFENANIVSKFQMTAVVFGKLQYGTIENVKVNNANVQGLEYVGGIVGYSYGVGGATVTGCSVTNSTISSIRENGAVGGIIGIAGMSGAISDNAVRNCTISGATRIGGIIGQYGSVSGIGTAENNTVSGNTVTATAEKGVWGEQIGSTYEPQEGDGGTILIPGYDDITLWKDEGVLNYFITNFEDNPCNTVIELVIKETGRVLYTSELLSPGEKFSKIPPCPDLEPGEYRVEIRMHNTSIWDDEVDLNGGVMETNLIVV